MGANWLAEIKEIETNRVDIKELRAMHKDLVEDWIVFAPKDHTRRAQRHYRRWRVGFLTQISEKAIGNYAPLKAAGRPARALGWCGPHRYRLLRHGNPLQQDASRRVSPKHSLHRLFFTREMIAWRGHMPANKEAMVNSRRRLCYTYRM